MANAWRQKCGARTPAQKTAADRPAAEAEKDSPLLDLSDQSVKKLIKTGKARGYVTTTS